MSNYEGKLGEWLKYVQQQIESAGTEGQSSEKSVQAPEKAAQVESTPAKVIVRDRMGQVSIDEVAEVEKGSVIADTSVLEARARRRDNSSIFDDSDVPDVEDFLPFLKDIDSRMDRRTPQQDVEPPIVNFPVFSEGTGEPKPIVKKPEETEVRDEAPVEVKAVAVPVQRVSEPVVGKVDFEAVSVTETPKSAEDIRAQWDRMPKHIQVLFGQAPEEVAQNSYKRFMETREDLVARLLDPTLSLEEAARILNVCPTTVRRYTNKGKLKHFRTAGNQRRFRLSDVLVFVESTTKH